MRKSRIVAASATLLIVAMAVGCEGFFVDPVLTGLTVGPAATIQTGTTLQMTAVGSYNDGSQKKLSKNVHWSSASPTVASIDSSGLVAGLGPGQSVIACAAETLTASSTVTVIVGNLASIQVTSQDGFTSITYGSSEQFVATGTANGQQVVLTTSVDWSTNPKVIPNVSIDPKSGLLTTTSGLTSLVQFQVIATDPTTGISGFMNFTVHQ
jgi:Bacterial Ig-like domain (group 2)